MTVEERYRDAGNAVGLVDGRVLVQLRWGEITVESVEAIGATAQRVLASLPADTRVGALLVQEPSAGVPDGAARDAQRRVLRGLAAGASNLRVAGVVMGTDLGARLRLTMVRMLTVGDERFRHFNSLEDAVSWLGHEMSPSPTAQDLRDAITALRARR
jgi:hypothetical protein